MDEVVTTTTDTTTAPPATTAAPSSFAEGVAQMREAEASVTAQPGAATTAQAATDEKASGTVTSTKGPIPFEVHDTALKNARDKTRAEVEAQYQRFKPLVALQEHELANAMRWAQTFSQDAPVAMEQALSAFAADPRTQQALMSYAARLLNQQRGRAMGDATDLEPEPDYDLPIRDAQGNQVGVEPMYSAKRQHEREAWLHRQWMKQVQGEIAPLKNVAETLGQRERLTSYKTTAAEAIARLKTSNPDFETHAKDVAELINSDPKLTRIAVGDPEHPDIAPDPETALEIAWARVLRQKVLPNISNKERSAVLASIQQKTTAGSINPSLATTARPTAPTGKFTPELVAAHFGAQG